MTFCEDLQDYPHNIRDLGMSDADRLRQAMRSATLPEQPVLDKRIEQTR